MKKMITIVLVTVISTLMLQTFITDNILKKPPTEVILRESTNILIPEKKINIIEVLLTDVRQTRELITMEVDLKETLEWDASWWDTDLFKKSQRITFFGTGLYTTDLSLLDEGDIILDEENNRILIQMNKPSVKQLALNEEKTEFESTERGILRFGEIKVTPEEGEILRKLAKDKMNEELVSEKNIRKANDYTKEVVIDMVSQFLKATQDEDYKIEIIWKG